MSTDDRPYSFDLLLSTSSDAEGPARGRPALHLPTALLATLHHNRQEATAAQLESQLQSLLDRLDVGAFRVDPEGRMLAASAVLRRLLGIGADEDIRQYNLYAFFVRRDPEPVLERLQRAGEIRSQEVQLRRADGVVIWVQLTETLDPPAADGPVVAGLMEEITEQKRSEEAMWLGEEYFRALVEGMSDLVCVLDAGGAIRYVSTSMQVALGYHAEVLIGSDVLDLVHPSGRAAMQRAVRQEVRAPGAVRALEITLRRREGGWQRCEAVVQNLLHDPVVSGIVVSARGVAEVPQRARRGPDSAARLRQALGAAATGVWELNVRSGRVHGSDHVGELLGLQRAPYRAGSGTFLQHVYPADVQQLREAARQSIEEGRDFDVEFRIVRRDGSVRWLCAKGKPLGGRVATRLVGTLIDTTERKLAQDKLLHDAFHDALTGLSNRALFMDRLNHTVAVAERSPGYNFAVLIIDLDHFKQINDTLGHLVGDNLLIAAARRLERCLRPGDTVTRWGGDEFTVLLGDMSDARDATRVAERVLREMRAPFSVDGHEIYSSASIGIAFSSTGFGRPDDMLRNADTALYRAKMRGRDRYEAFDQEMHRRAMALLQLENDLRQAEDRGELRVLYQPIISLETGTIGAFEALLRWEHSKRGTLAPGEFLAVAEDSGLVLDLDRWVLGEACRQLNDWTTRYPDAPLKMSVNLSSKDFAHPDLVERIRTTLRETGLDGADLRVELAEKVFFENREAAAGILRQLKELDIGVQIDNFGTGTSAVTSLHQYPIDAFKIDRSLVGRLGNDAQAPGIVRALVELAHNLDMKVIAEGTETEEQLRVLRELGCDYAQGFLFAAPSDSDAVDAMLTGSPSW